MIDVTNSISEYKTCLWETPGGSWPFELVLNRSIKAGQRGRKFPKLVTANFRTFPARSLYITASTTEAYDAIAD